MQWTQMTGIELAIAIFFIALVLTIHIYYHLRKHGNEHIVLRSLFLGLGLLGLLLLYLKPITTTEIPAKNIVINTTDSNDEVDEFNTVHEVINATEVFDTVIIRGDGLSAEDLTLLDSFHIKFIPREKQKGFTNIQIPTVKEKEAWTLIGNLNQQEPQNILLELSDGKTLETTSGTDGKFSLRVSSKSPGHFTYKLSTQFADSTYVESFPLEVLPSEKWNLLALSSSPSFELNYLKNYWVKLGNGFSLRQKVSDSRFKETFLNNPKIALEKINSQTLNKFNFLLVDAISWNGLKVEEQNLVLKYVGNGRIGLLFVGLGKGDVISKVKNLSIESEQEILNEDLNVKFSKINTPSGFRKTTYQKLPSAAVRNYGLGNIGLMTINNTNRLILVDQTTTYQNIWANIFSELYIAPSDDIVFKSSKWNWEGEDIDINIYSRKELDKTGLLNGNVEVPITPTQEQNGLFSSRLKSQAGWNNLQLESSNAAHKFYVHPINSWQAMKQAHLHKINHLAASKTKNLPNRFNKETNVFPFYWGLLISLLGFGLLWLHERVFS